MKKISLLKFGFSFILVLLISLVFGCGSNEITTELTDSLKLTASYENKSFLDDGIGLVTLTQKVDGDTARFRDSNGLYFTARFLRINTPESTGKIEPWGKAASDYTANALANAKEIVCESEELNQKASLDTTGKRYLAYIWYRNSDSDDFRLLNLELIEVGLTNFTDTVDNSKYGETLQKAADKGRKNGYRLFGEKDPDYDYSYKVHDITISYLKEHLDEYISTQGIKLKIKARIVRFNGDNIYLEDYESTSSDVSGEYSKAGIYLYSGYGKNFSGVSIGDVLSFNCNCVASDTYGFQLTNVTNLEIIEEGNGEDVEHRTFDGTEEIDFESLEGLVIKVSKVKVLGVTDANENGAYSISVSTDSGQKFKIRIDGNTYPKYDRTIVEVGAYYSIIGGVSQYEENFQIMLCNQKKGFTKEDFKLLENSND